MKIGTTSHPKFRSLMRALNLPQYAVVGLLESVWTLAAQFADDGDLSRFSAQEIADYAGYDGNADELLLAMIASRWLDGKIGTLRVHDWLDHCPHYVHDRRRKRKPNSVDTSVSVESLDVSLNVPGNSRNLPEIPMDSDPTQPNPTISNQTMSNQNIASLSVSSSKTKTPKEPKPQWAMPDGVKPDHWRDWLSHRKVKGLANTPTTWAKVEREAANAGWSIPRVVQLCAEKPWGRFEASWVAQESTSAMPIKPKTVYPRPARPA